LTECLQCPYSSRLLFYALPFVSVCSSIHSYASLLSNSLVQQRDCSLTGPESQSQS
ncbi:hypothetical protein GBF38_002253, partial [Nibea albiflora]